MKNIQKPRKDQIHVVSMSGGKDSTATALTAMDLGYDFVGAFADTGNEHEITYKNLEDQEKTMIFIFVTPVRECVNDNLSTHKKFSET